jgi:hypothetical protein
MPPRETRAAGDNFAAGDAKLRDDIAKLCRRRLQAHVDTEPRPVDVLLLHRDPAN